MGLKRRMNLCKVCLCVLETNCVCVCANGWTEMYFEGGKTVLRRGKEENKQIEQHLPEIDQPMAIHREVERLSSN